MSKRKTRQKRALSAQQSAHARTNRVITNRTLQFVNMPAFPSFSGYTLHGASIDPDLQWQVMSASPRWDIDMALPGLRARARDLYISSTLCSAAIDTRAHGAVGQGLRLDAQPAAEVLELSPEDASALDRKIEAAWAAWADRAGADGQTLDDIIQAVSIACLQSGDVFIDVRITESGRMSLELIEGDRVDSPSTMLDRRDVCAGVHFASTGRPIAYYISDLAQFEPGGLQFYTRRAAFRAGYYDALEGIYTLPAGGILHAHMPFERPGQARGIPACSKVLLDSKFCDRYRTAELDAAAISACASMCITHPREDAEAALDAYDSFSGMAAEGDNGSTATPIPTEPPHPAYSLKPGAVFHLEPGADVRSFSPTRPNPQLPAFLDAIESRICSALGLPYEVVARRYDSSYSASRAARLDAQCTYDLDRQRIVAQVLKPIYEAWLDLNAARLGLSGYYGSFETRQAYRKAAFIGSGLPSIDPEKEVRSSILAINAGLSTHQREAQVLTGQDFSTICRTLANEEQQLRSAGLVKDQNGRPIDDVA